ncbi:TPA: hypothetical protein N3A16_002843 [Salmonella enterica subsp. diarizonae serovar 53:z10:z35]|nr:hypothetical protein [Salmonella enterica subsp. diarizonae serovar 53:z10:z35]
MTTITNNKLTDEQLQEIYGEAVSCELAEKNGAYMACFDLLCKMDDVGGTAHVVRKLIDMLRAEWVELQELRRNYLALRGEIEDVRSQLYEAENQANEYASELQDRRRADNDEPFGFVTKRCAEHMHDDDRDENNWMWSISAVVIGCNPKLKHEVPVYLHPASSGKEGA